MKEISLEKYLNRNPSGIVDLFGRVDSSLLIPLLDRIALGTYRANVCPHCDGINMRFTDYESIVYSTFYCTYCFFHVKSEEYVESDALVAIMRMMT